MNWYLKTLSLKCKTIARYLYDGSNTMWYSRIIVDYSNKKVIVMETNHPAGGAILNRLTRILDAFADRKFSGLLC